MEYYFIVHNDSLSNAVRTDYTEALGLAAFTFATCEWQVVWCSEKIKPGTLSKLSDDPPTAGVIAKSFIDLTRNMFKSKDRMRLRAIAKQFARLVNVRNAILHGKPCANSSGAACLSSDQVMEIDYLENAADEFTACSDELNKLFYGFLSTYTPR